MQLYKSEEEILSALNLGKEEVLTVLFDRYQQSLLYLSKSYVISLLIAEEIVSDAFFKFWSRKDNFHSIENIKAFLFIAVKNASLNYVNTKKNLKTISFGKEHESIPSESNSLSKIIEAEFISQILAEIEKLPEKQKQVLTLSFTECRSTEEISSILGMSSNAVYVNRTRAIEKLKSVFKNNPLIICFLLSVCFQN